MLCDEGYGASVNDRDCSACPEQGQALGVSIVICTVFILALLMLFAFMLRSPADNEKTITPQELDRKLTTELGVDLFAGDGAAIAQNRRKTAPDPNDWARDPDSRVANTITFNIKILVGCAAWHRANYCRFRFYRLLAAWP